MPLVHIHVTESRRTPAQLTLLADSIQQVMREYFDAPDRDRYQIITEPKRGAGYGGTLVRANSQAEGKPSPIANREEPSAKPSVAPHNSSKRARASALSTR